MEDEHVENWGSVNMFQKIVLQANNEDKMRFYAIG